MYELPTDFRFAKWGGAVTGNLREKTPSERAMGARLREFRESRQMEQKELARRLKIPVRTYQDYEHGNSHPKATVLRDLAELGCDLMWLLTGQGGAPGSRSEVQSAIDETLMARITDAISRTYRETSTGLSPALLGRLSARNYSSIVTQSTNPDRQDELLDKMVEELRAALRQDATGTSPRKPSASSS